MSKLEPGEDDLQYRRLVSFATAAAAVAYGGGLTDTLNAICAEARATAGLAAVQILLIDPATTRLGLHGAAPASSFGPGFTHRLEEVRRRGAQFMSIRSLRAGVPVITPGRRTEMLADPAWAPLHDHLRGFDWDAFVAVPLRVREEPIGAMNAYCRPGQVPEAADMTFLSALADQVSVAVQHARLHAEATVRRTDAERHRMARGLHDSACQELFSINLHARTILNVLDAHPAGNGTGATIAEQARAIGALASCALEDLREVVHELYPTSLAREGPVAVIDRLAQAIADRDGLDVQVQAPPGRLGTTSEVDLEVFHVVREALHNVVKHARARRVRIRLGPDPRDGATLVVEVRDDGVGTTPGHPAGDRTAGLGLRSMRDRVERLGGELFVGPVPDGPGTLVRATIPAVIGAAR